MHSPWSKSKADKVPGMLEAPLPAIEEQGDPNEPEPRQPVLLPSGDVDEEAELMTMLPQKQVQLGHLRSNHNNSLWYKKI